MAEKTERPVSEETIEIPIISQDWWKEERKKLVSLYKDMKILKPGPVRV